MHNLLFCAHTLWLNYVADTFLLVSSSGTINHDLCVLCTVRAKKANKNIEQRRLPSFIKCLPLLTMTRPFGEYDFEP